MNQTVMKVDEKPDDLKNIQLHEMDQIPTEQILNSNITSVEQKENQAINPVQDLNLIERGVAVNQNENQQNLKSPESNSIT